MTWKTITLDKAKQHELWYVDCHFQSVIEALAAITLFEILSTIYYYHTKVSGFNLIAFIGFLCFCIYIFYKLSKSKNKHTFIKFISFIWFKFIITACYTFYVVGDTMLTRRFFINIGLAYGVIHFGIMIYTHFSEVYNLQYLLKIKG